MELTYTKGMAGIVVSVWNLIPIFYMRYSNPWPPSHVITWGYGSSDRQWTRESSHWIYWQKMCDSTEIFTLQGGPWCGTAYTSRLLLKRLKREEPWIQFKFKWLGDIHYKCGHLTYVTRKCHFDKPATIKIETRMEAHLYGPLMKLESSGSILFVNSPMDTKEQFQIGKFLLESWALESPNPEWLNTTPYNKFSKL